jgi:hypothetical protein
MADQLVDVLDGNSAQTIGPALGLVFSYFLVAASGARSSLRDVLSEVGALARRHGALKQQHTVN